MKNRAYFLMLAATTLLSAPAMAAPVFMLQFGSFETRGEAETRLASLKSEHGGIVNGMQSGIREVTLPPDNLVVYRTQAGPVETRAQAQSICSQLASDGEECYVVETAMAPSFAAPATQVAQTTPPAAPAPAAAPQPVPAAVPAPLAAAPVAAPVAASTALNPRATAPAGTSASAPKLATTTTPTPAPAAMSTSALAMQNAGSTLSPQAEPPVVMAPIPTRDPKNAAAINSVTAAPVTAKTTTSAAPVAMASANTTVSPDMQKAMDEAVKEQNESLSARQKSIKEAPTPAGAKEEGTFWSRLNPFSDDEDEVAAKPAPVPPAPVKAPVETVEAKAVVPAPVAPPAPPAPMAAPAPVMAPEPLSPLPQGAPAPIVMAAPAPAAPPAPILPPPPAPLVGKGAIAPTMSTAASLRTPAPVITPEPTGTLGAPAPIVISDAPGNVRVGEAQRVPLSQATVPAPVPAMPAPPAPTVLTPGAPAVALHPNATLGQKTLWAHVGQFVDAQAALAFWDQYRQSHPDFPVVRVRVTSPLQSLNRGNDQVSLRVGPFAKESSIGNLCKTIQDGQRAKDMPQLMCGPITDMGIANRVGGARSGYLPGSRYNR